MVFFHSFFFMAQGKVPFRGHLKPAQQTQEEPLWHSCCPVQPVHRLCDWQTDKAQAVKNSFVNSEIFQSAKPLTVKSPNQTFISTLTGPTDSNLENLLCLVLLFHLKNTHASWNASMMLITTVFVVAGWIPSSLHFLDIICPLTQHVILLALPATMKTLGSTVMNKYLMRM